MFGKLIKAEWRASRRVVGILCLAVLIAALVLGFVGCGLFMAETRRWNVHGTVEIVVALLCVAGLMVINVAWRPAFSTPFGGFTEAVLPRRAT